MPATAASTEPMMKVIEMIAIGRDPHQRGRLEVERDRAHGPAELRAVDDVLQQPHEDHSDDQHDDLVVGRGHAAEVDEVLLDERGEELRIGAEDELAAVLEQERHADGRDQRRDARRVAQRPVGDALVEEAEQSADDHRPQHDQRRRSPSRAGRRWSARCRAA